jgi:hypothetical protein
LASIKSNIAREDIMRRISTTVLALGFGAAFAALTGTIVAADDQQVALQSDRALADVIAKTDAKAAAALLDDGFAWTDVTGKTQNKAQALQNLSALTASTQGDTEVQMHAYGELATVRGSRPGARFLHVWVKRPDGWKAFLVLDTPIATAAAAGPASVEAAAGQGDCDNPCRTVPYVPKTKMDEAILAAWQKTKMIEWKPDAAAWATFIADEFMIINNTTVRNKTERVAIAKKQQDAGVGAPGDPVTAMDIHDFGDNAAVMVSQHFPYRGGKPYTNVRVWVLRDGRWQLALSQQTAIQSAAPMPAVAQK